MSFCSLFKSKAKSPAENVGRLQAEAKRFGVDKESLTTSMGGMVTDHYEIYKRVRDEKTFRISRKAYIWACISALVSICSLMVVVVGLVIKNPQ